MEKPDFQRDPLNLNFIKKNVEDFLTRKVLISVNFSIVSFKQELLERKFTNENKQFK